ncbi:MAG: AAA family ATPase [Leptospiraceae bacterium]|nr:AAA family ATPase [Leptospiraceae bacterium]MDW7976058.1 AAA family ATPase [Leptospiraceae bacterium]
MEKVILQGVEIELTPPEQLDVKWVGNTFVKEQLKAAWMKVHPEDMPLNPRLIGKPGVGKTTLACAVAIELKKPFWIFQATMDTRPEDLIITPVISAEGKIKYVASGIVSAMIKGGIAILDEGNRMGEKSWASLAPLLDHRRYVESIIVGIKIKAHDEFRFVTTMNEDASTFEIPEYIQSRLQPSIYIDFADADEEKEILRANIPFAPPEIITYVVNFLQRAHFEDEPYSIRDGINITRMALKLAVQKRYWEPENRKQKLTDKQIKEILHIAVQNILGDEALRYIEI